MLRVFFVRWSYHALSPLAECSAGVLPLRARLTAFGPSVAQNPIAFFSPQFGHIARFIRSHIVDKLIGILATFHRSSHFMHCTNTGPLFTVRLRLNGRYELAAPL